MLGILADDHDLALTANDLALFADRLHRRTNLHVLVPPQLMYVVEGAEVSFEHPRKIVIGQNPTRLFYTLLPDPSRGKLPE